ncbi:MAG TPA: PHP domain-containing protein, partial [Methylomirabilota bacterium]|nr:PHP domain-containing protein [Methylomirabilota bacterium]
LGPHPAPPGWPPPSDLTEYTAVLHVHSRYSHDGRGTVEEIAAAAHRAGVRVVFLTDHNTLAPLQEDQERWYGPTLVLVGAEITTGSGYLLLLDPRPDLPVRARGYALDDLVRRYREAGAIVLLAHPEHTRLGWRGEWPPIDGLEVIDVFDQLVGATLGRQILGLLAYPANPVMAVLSMAHWPRPVMARWDALAMVRPTVGVLALDAHGGVALTEESNLNFPSHETAFRMGRLHFVTTEPLGEDRADRTRVYRAFRAGRFYNAFDGFAPAQGFRFHLLRGSQRILMGETVTASTDLALEARVPPLGSPVVRVMRDGEVLHEATGHAPLRLPIPGPGVYRVEVDLRLNLFPLGGTRAMPWIFSNPIYVRP